eukprot:CAMPEP_0182834216 /NCGR_PEP_ID=MMETSP0006_2-20121128/20785_1 /TAXON_ID=97485 /ORGANISM="Prymnesium parvum, Strain Texoma1" /LENGTH=104 /DNA_ID=CAMNT_0024962425 /DNA_START=185 /DNA_END=496 /DNA_ORIENTATION=-
MRSFDASTLVDSGTGRPRLERSIAAFVVYLQPLEPIVISLHSPGPAACLRAPAAPPPEGRPRWAPAGPSRETEPGSICATRLPCTTSAGGSLDSLSTSRESSSR